MIIWSICLFSAALCASAEPANINSGFEAGEPPAAQGWQSDDIEGARWTLTEDMAHEGKRSMKLQCAGALRETPVRLVGEPVAVSAGDAVEFMVWTRSHGTPRSALKVYVEGQERGAWRTLLPMVDRPQSERWMNSEWTPRTEAVFVPGGVGQVRLVAEAAAVSEIRVSWYLDDFSLRIVSFRGYCEERKGQDRLPDIYLATPDALAQNTLGCYGEARVPTPHLDRLASEGRVYTQASAASPWTKPSFASIHSGMYPSQHTVEGVYSALPDRVTTLAEQLKQRGYFTIAFVWSPYDGFLGPYMQFGQGFDLYVHSEDEALVTEQILRFLETNRDTLGSRTGGGFFIWHHIFEPHIPYVNWRPDFVPNTEGKLGPVTITGLVLRRISGCEPGFANEADERYVHDVYKLEVNRTDSIIGEVLGRMQWAGVSDTLNVLFAADHGESFNEKPGIWGHCTPYETCMRIPLIVRFPGRVPPGERDSELVNQLDFMPTILDLAGAPIPPECEGRSLLKPAPADVSPYSISEGLAYQCLSIRDARYKLAVVNASQPKDVEKSINVWDLTQARYELYDLQDDPLELHECAAALPEVLERLKQALLAHCEHVGITGKAGAVPENKALADDTREALEAVGYIGGDKAKGGAVEKRGEGGLGNMGGLF